MAYNVALNNKKRSWRDLQRTDNIFVRIIETDQYAAHIGIVDMEQQAFQLE